jgi:hypothetical protein
MPQQAYDEFTTIKAKAKLKLRRQSDILSAHMQHTGSFSQAKDRYLSCEKLYINRICLLL